MIKRPAIMRHTKVVLVSELNQLDTKSHCLSVNKANLFNNIEKNNLPTNWASAG